MEKKPVAWAEAKAPWRTPEEAKASQKNGKNFGLRRKGKELER